MEVTFQFQSGTEHGRIDEADRGHEPEDKDAIYCVYLFTERGRERERGRETERKKEKGACDLLVQTS